MEWQALPPAEVISTPSKITYIPPDKIHAMDMEYQNSINPKANGYNKQPKFLEEAKEAEGKPTVGQVLRTFLSDRLSAHAIPRIFKSPSVFRQVIWTLVSLLFLGLLMWQVTDTIKTYFTYPKTTTIEVQDATWVRFPAVTVCSLSPLVKAKACNTRWKSAVTVSDENACSESSEGTDSTASPQNSETSPPRRLKRSPSETQGSSYSGYSKSYSSYSYGSYPSFSYSSSEDSDYEESSSQSDTHYSSYSPSYYYPSEENLDELFSSVSGSSSSTAEYSSDPYSSHYGSSEDSSYVSDKSHSHAAHLTQFTSVVLTTTPQTTTETAQTTATLISTEEATTTEDTTYASTTSQPDTTSSGTSEGTLEAGSSTSATEWNDNPSTVVLTTSSQTTTQTAQATATFNSTEEATTTENTTYASTPSQPDTTSSGTSEGTLEAGNSTSATEWNDTSYNTSSTVYDYPEYYDDDDSYAKVDSLTQSQFHNLSIDNFEGIIEAMETSDGSQIAMVFTPSEKEISEAGISGDEFIVSCSYNGETCHSKDFLSWQSGIYGNCFTFNSVFERMLEDELLTKTSGQEYLKWTRKTSHVGARYGLRLMLNVSEEDVITSVSPNIGARVSIHHPQSVPFPEDHGLNIQPKTSTAIGISTTKLLRKSAPYGNCSKNEEWNQKNIGSYTSDACVNICLENRVRERCTCIGDVNTILHHSHEGRHLPRCNPTNATQDKCFATVTSKYLKNEETCACPPACDETSYAVTSSFNEINTKFFSLMVEKKNADIPPQPMALHIYMDTLSTSLVIESPSFTAFTLVSNVGGMFGLFVGLSLVTIVEVLEFMFDFIAMFAWQVVCCRACKRTKETTKVMPK